MKFPRSVRSGGASLVVAVSLLLAPLVCAQRPAKPTPAPTTSRKPNAAAASERVPAATFDTLLSADAYGVYAEMRMVGQQAASEELANLITPLTLDNGAPNEVALLYKFIKAHAEPLMTARLMFATMPVRAGLPEVLLAIEMPSVEEARKFLPELKQFIAASVAPKMSGRAGSTTTTTTNGADEDNPKRVVSVRVDQRTRAQVVGDRARGAVAGDLPAVLPFQVKRSGSIIAMSIEAFTFKKLRGRDEALLFNEPGFQAARARFGSDALFVYFNPVRMFDSAKQKQETLEKEYRRQEELAQAEARKRDEANAADGVKIEPSVGDSTLATSPEGNSNNSNVAIVSSQKINSPNVNVPMSPEDEIPPSIPEATPTPKTEKELKEELQREQSRRFAQTMGSLVFGDGPSSTSSWPESIGVGVSLESDSLVLRGLFVNLADDQPLRPIPFLPVVLSGPSIAAEAPTVLPADTDIFVTASLDLPQMYDYLASMMKILDLASAGGDDGKGGFSDQLMSFEKTNNFRIKEELLSALGNEIAVALPAQFLGGRSGRQRGSDISDAAPTPSGPIAVIALNDKKALQELLPRVLSAIGFTGATEQSVIEKHGDVEVLTFSNGTLAFIDRFLVSTPDAATMRRITDAYNNGETLANSERFRDSTSWQSKQGVGQVYVSNAVLKNMFEDVTKSVNDIDDQAVRAFLLALNPEPGALTHSATRESNGLLHEVHVPKNLLSLFTASSLISQKLSRQRSNESMAQWKLRMLRDAQNEYKYNKGRYGTLEELQAAGHLNEEYASMEMDGYEIKFSFSGDKFEATATPKAYPKLGRRSFYISNIGNLRGGDTGGKPASDSDPIVDY